MTRARWMTIAFVCTIVAQLVVPASLIGRHEWTLRTGAEFRFRTAPIDPYDAFRGKYVALRLETNVVSISATSAWKRLDRAFVQVHAGEDGFARLGALHRKRPKDPSCVGVRIGYVTDGKAHLKIPIDRFYLEEELAPKAEAAYREWSGREERMASVVVRIRKGVAVIDDVLIGEQSIVEFVRNEGR